MDVLIHALFFMFLVLAYASCFVWFVEPNSSVAASALGLHAIMLGGVAGITAVYFLMPGFFGLDNSGDYAFAVIVQGLACTSAIVYALPAAIAKSRSRRNWVAITVLNLFLGVTFVGWVIALVWAFIEDR